MERRYHINKQGVIAVCRAQNGNCPFGGESGNENHFATKKEGQKELERRSEEEFGLLPIASYCKKAISNEDKELVKSKIEKLLNRSAALKRRKVKNEGLYTERCLSSEQVENFSAGRNSLHFKKDRGARISRIKRNFGEGESVGFYDVNEIYEAPDGTEQERNTILNIRSTGQIIVYGKDDSKLITTFMASRNRVETIMLKAGMIPNNDFLREVERNRNKDKDLKLENEARDRNKMKNNNEQKVNKSESTNNNTERNNKRANSNATSQNINKNDNQSNNEKKRRWRRKKKSPSTTNQNVPAQKNSDKQQNSSQPRRNRKENKT